MTERRLVLLADAWCCGVGGVWGGLVSGGAASREDAGGLIVQQSFPKQMPNKFALSNGANYGHFLYLAFLSSF